MKEYISIVFWMRAIACLGVVLIHSISHTLSINPNLEKNQWPTYVQLFLMFCTPMFVFIAEFLNARFYGDKLKKGFFRKRFLYLGVPFLVVNLIWTLLETSPSHFSNFLSTFILVSFRGYSVTYFIVIIFQFYLLHIIFSKYLRKLNPITVITISIIITSFYWGIRLIIPAPDNIVGALIWAKEGQTLFIGWITYFLLGYYIGIYYDSFIQNLKHYRLHIIGLMIFSIIFVLLTHNLGINSAIGSKRLDTPLYTTAIILFLFLASSYFKYVPKFILFVSNFSFSIYLLHLFFIYSFPMTHNHFGYDILYKFLLAIVMSIICAYLVNRLRVGKYIIGSVTKLDHAQMLKGTLK
ncbi:adhesion protein [Staphylococcus felis]|uniref:acyltransferase family protein n=1 Tax=Staphylococcus felis TaxID=46127 RepID=UPI000E25E68F|nr:acyltransferase family protein [Staphylococcus felis]REI27600.1 adhesion protein [Staphylococcus felis]